MKIEKVLVGELKTNCYVLDINNNVLVIDPGDDADKIIRVIGNRNILGVIITHYHADHFGVMDEIVRRYGVREDKYNAQLNKRNAQVINENDVQLNEYNTQVETIDDAEDKYNIWVLDRHNMAEGINQVGEFKFEVIYTPGHKEDLVTIYFREDKVMFCGDFIFKDSIGRCDLPGGNISEMMRSIDKIKKYDKDIVIYPGHGEKTTLGYEVNNNYYFKMYL